jgi:subfamily B ATP-binding cassette protein MsbA
VPAKRSPLLRLVAYARPYLGVLVLSLLCSGLYSGARMARNYLVKPLVDDVLAAATRSSAPTALGWPGFSHLLGGPLTVADHFLALMLAASLVALVLPLANFGADYLGEWALGRVLIDMQQQMATKLLTLPLGFHQELRRGDALTRTLNDGLRAHGTLRTLVSDVSEAVIGVAASVATLLAVSWQLTLLTLGLAPVLIVVVAAFGRRIRRNAQRRQETMSEVTQRLVQILSGIKVIKAFRAEQAEEEAFERENQRLFRRGMKVVKNRVWSRSSVEGVSNLAGMTVLGLGTWLVLRGSWGLTAGSLTAFFVVMITAQRTTRDLTKAWTQLQDALPSAQRYFELIDSESERADPPDAVRIDGLRHGIHVAKVSFSYGREAVLRDVSLDVRAGEVVALVGRTGAGKTTLADLLLRFYEPDSGSIELDGVDLRRIARDSLLAHVAVVTQDAFLFDGSIRDNIRYGRPDASDAEVEAAARAAHVDEFVAGMPDGYATQVGESGTRLSGGQRQRVTIARALLKNPTLLIFDEATSSLDAKSERLVQDAIDKLLANRTVIVIAHRLSTIRHADKIVVLENGAVSQLGTHDELVAEPGLYRELVSLQSGSTADGAEHG